MTLNLSFFKKSIITGLALAIGAGVIMAFLAHANAIQNNQITTHGTGYILGLSPDQDKLIKIGGASTTTTISQTGPNVCGVTTDSNCHCPQLGQLCKKCFTAEGETECAECPSNPHMMIACRVDADNDDENDADDQEPVVTPTVTPTTTTEQNNVGRSNDSNQPTQPMSTGGGNTTGLEPADPLPQNNSGASCPPETHPMQGRPCFYREPGQSSGQSGGNVCAPPRMCAAL